MDWYPWGEAAFEKARPENKPIFLSIGYSTCHWCHVMERESFRERRDRGILNRDFVPIKVDREERPDVDRIYMTFVQATTGGGGWPMSVWLTPDLKPFFGGTYFPPENRYGHPGFRLHAGRRSRRPGDSDREKIVESAQRCDGAAARSTWRWRPTVPARPSTRPRMRKRLSQSSAAPSIRASAASAVRPNFRAPRCYNFLLRYYARTKNQEALDMVLPPCAPWPRAA